MPGPVWLNDILIFDSVDSIIITEDIPSCFGRNNSIQLSTAIPSILAQTSTLLNNCMGHPHQSNLIKITTGEETGLLFSEVVIVQVTFNYHSNLVGYYNVSFYYDSMSHFIFFKNEKSKEKACNFRQIVICRNTNKIKNHNLAERPVMLR